MDLRGVGSVDVHGADSAHLVPDLEAVEVDAGPHLLAAVVLPRPELRVRPGFETAPSQRRDLPSGEVVDAQLERPLRAGG